MKYYNIEIMNLRKEKPKYSYDIRVDRSSILGNPFPMKGESQRDKVCEQYEQYFNEQIQNTDTAFTRELIRILDVYKTHGKLRLFCWCAPKRCHAETIKAWIENTTNDPETLNQGKKYYTGVGSRKTPEDILNLMKVAAHCLEKEGYVLRSGGAGGADSAFEEGVGQTENKQIFYTVDATKEAMELASQFHPAWNKCNPYVRKLHGRNAFQVLGPELNSPSNFLVCWTPDGCVSHKERSIATGETGTAISIAEANRVKVYNLQRENHYLEFYLWIKKLYNKYAKSKSVKNTCS